MKSSLLCLQCIFVYTLSSLLVLADDANAPQPLEVPASPPENISSDSEHEIEKPLKIDGSSDAIRDLEPSVDVDSFNEKIEEDTFKVIVEATSQNSGVANDITTSGPPVAVTLSDVATAELQQRAILPSQNNKDDDSQTNQTSNNIPLDPDVQDINQTRSELPRQTENIDILSVKENLTEEIPSFSEWAQKQLEEEAEKNKGPLNASTQHQNVNGGKAKLQWKNYASPDCGAKVVATNPETVSPSAVLSPSRDEYQLNTCTSKIWFVVELCEAIQAKKIDLANFELFSSSPKDFAVSVSDRFPTREWTNVGNFAAKDERDIQSFDLNPHLFGKYIKVEVKSLYGHEHFCPISLFRVYGTSEFEVLQKEDTHSGPDDEDDGGDDAIDPVSGDGSKNVFSSAKDAVISMVKKAAEVLGNKGNHSNQTEIGANIKQAVPLVRVCNCPSHLVVCDNCTDALFGQVYELLSCEDAKVNTLVNFDLFRRALMTTDVCQRFGFDFSKSTRSLNAGTRYMEAILPERVIGAMCNMIAIFQNKVVLNVSSHYSNDTQTDEEKLNIETSELNIVAEDAVKEEPEITDALNVEVPDAVTKSTCSTDVNYANQIKPTKTLPSIDVKESTVEVINTEEIKPAVEEAKVNVSEEVEQEKLVDVVETVTESVELLEDPLEHLLEFNGDKDANAQSTTSATPQGQKESVFLRLSNRIKALERNMSLSGQYLEELSKRYKKQVEEIQKLLDKTVSSMAEESKKKEERNKQLEERLLALTANVEALIAERRSWSSTIYCVVVSSLVTLFVVTFCCRVPEPSASRRLDLKRRKSVDVAAPPPQKKKRRPSDQALKIVRSAMEANKKKKKKQLLKRSNSISTLGEEKTSVWSRQESAPAEANDWTEGKHIEEVPFVLEESEHSSLEPLVLGDKLPQAQGFIKTALSSRAGRVNGEVKRKSASVDESSSRKLAVNGLMGDGEVKDKKKGLKRIFKKVF